MLTAKLLLYTAQEPTKRGFPLKIRVTVNRKTKYVPLGKYSDLEYWDEAAQSPKRNHPDKTLQNYVLDKKKEVSQLEQHCNDNHIPMAEALLIFKNGLKPKFVKMGLLEFYQLRIGELEAEGAGYRLHEDTREQLRQYLIGNDMPMAEVNYELVHGFKQWKLNNGTGMAGVSAYLRNLSKVYNDALLRKSLNLPDTNPCKGLIPKAPRKRPKNKALTFDELRLLNHWSGLRKESTRHIKLVMFQFFIGGHDYCDISALRWKDIEGGRAVFYRYKLRNRGAGLQVNNILLPEAQEIIKQYGTPNKERVFAFLPDIKQDELKHKNHVGNVRRALRIAFEQLGIDKPALAKTMRHTFRTLARRQFIDGDLVAEIQAHQEGGVEYNYQELFPEAERDAALKQMVNKLNEPMELQMVV